MTDLVPTQRPTDHLARQVAAYLHTLTPGRINPVTTPASPDDLITWLRAQLDDDERVAKRVEPNQAPTELRAMVTREGSQPFLVIDSARVLAEVDAKRRILDLAGSIPDQHDDEQVWYQQAIGDVLRRMTLPYADREGFREEWRA